MENLLDAWKEFRRGKRTKPDVALFEFNLEDELFSLHRELEGLFYKHSPYKSFYIHDPKRRHIHKACVRDRIVHQALFRVLSPIFDKQFIFDSYSCRMNKGTHKAVFRLDSFINKATSNHKHPAFALKCDIVRFFDSIDHRILLNLIERKIQDENVLKLICIILNSYRVRRNKGLPLGNVTSQLFANIYLNPLDQFAKHKLKTKYYLRYCDDFVFIHQDTEKLRRFINPIKSFLSENLSLNIHEDKTEIRKRNQGIDFLGYVLLPYHRVLRTRTRRRMFRKLKEKEKQKKNGKLDSESLYQSYQSYLGILEHCNGYKIRKSIEKIYIESQFF